MTMARALVLEAPERLVEREIAIPELGAGEALLEVMANGICGSDHELFTGTMKADLPLVAGHEVVGRIVQATTEYLSARGLDEGDVVALEVFQRCGRCEPCINGNYALCRNHGFPDSYGNTPLSVGSGLWGGYSTHLVLARDSLVHKLPEGMDPVYATLFNPLGAGVRWGGTMPKVKEGDVVAVLGPGLRGLSSAAVASILGARFVVLTGAGDRDATRLELGLALGADRAVDVTKVDLKALLKSETGGLADVVVDVTAAAPAAFAQALDVVRPGGTVCVAGTRGVKTLAEFNPDRIVLKELTVLGARGVEGASYARAISLLESDDRFTKIPHVVAPLTVESVSDLLHSMSTGGDPPVHAVIVP